MQISHLASSFALLAVLALAGCSSTTTSKSNTNKSDAAPKTHKVTPAKPVQHIHVPATHQVANTHVRVSQDSNAGLVNVIRQSMTGILPGKQGPARWTVAVSSLDGKQNAYVTNWSPAHAQSSASTIKLFILIRYYQELKAHHLRADDTFTLTQQDKKTKGSGILLKKKVGSTYTLSELVKLMIHQSDNIATNALIDRLGGFKGVNQTISDVVGPTHYSTLERKMMDTRNLTNGLANRINAWKATQMLVKIYRGDLLGASSDRQMLQLMAKTDNRTKLPSQLPAGAIAWNKSGEANFKGIENDMAIIKYQGHVFAVTALVELNTDGEGEDPDTATGGQTASQINAIARLGANVTNWMAQQ